MELQTITMQRDEARRAFLDYKRALEHRHDEEAEAVMRGYRELAKGRQLIHLSETIRLGGAEERSYRNYSGRHEVMLPRLAVCRADERWCSVDVRSDKSLVFVGLKDHERNYAGHRSRLRRVRATSWHDAPQTVNQGTFDAMVPMVPPPLRPAGHLRNYHVLFEADWRLRSETMPAPRDPALLRRLEGDLFAVLAVWDLTDLERAVLSGRVGP